MKTNTFKLFTVLVLLLSISCSVEDIQTETENAKIEKNQKIKESSESQARQSHSSSPSPIFEHVVLNDIPQGTETMTIYLNMAWLESTATNNNYLFPVPCIIDFNVCYLNVMQSEFTIYNVTRTATLDPQCANIEKWVVNKAEYLAYSTFVILINNTGNNTNSGEKEIKTLLPPSQTENPDDEEQPDTIGGWMMQDCFDN